MKGTRRRRAATRLTKPQQPATLTIAAASGPCRPASSESVAAFDRTRWPAPAAAFIGMGIMTPMLGIGREKLGQTRSLMPHHPMPTYAFYMTRFDWQRNDRCVTSVCHLWRGDRSDQRFRRDDHAE